MKKRFFGFITEISGKVNDLRNVPLNKFTAVCAVLAALILLQGVAIGKNVYKAASGTIDWGLSFPEEGKMPVGNSSVEFLKKYDGYFVDEGKEKVIYLTFDSGYENGYTEKILDTLKEKNVKAAFFLVGHYMETAPELVRRMNDEGHLVCNHSFSHPDMTALSKQDFMAQLTELEDVYKTLTGKDINKFYRPPSGKYNENTLSWAKEAGYRTILWSLAYADWDNEKQPTEQTAFEKILPRLHDGCILLLHSTSRTNSVILGELIDEIIFRGYTFGSLDELGRQEK